MIIIRVVNNKTEREKKEKKKKEVNKAGRPSMTMILDRTSHEFLLFLLLFFFSFSLGLFLFLFSFLSRFLFPFLFDFVRFPSPPGSEKLPRLNRTDSTVIRKKINYTMYVSTPR